MLSKTEILKQVNELFKDILENEKITVTSATTADDIEEWDSLSHIQLVVAIEKHFKMRFTTSEISAYKNVGEMCEGIERKLSAK